MDVISILAKKSLSGRMALIATRQLLSRDCVAVGQITSFNPGTAWWIAKNVIEHLYSRVRMVATRRDHRDYVSESDRDAVVTRQIPHLQMPTHPVADPR